MESRRQAAKKQRYLLLCDSRERASDWSQGNRIVYPHKAIIDEIVSLEWEMFQDVNHGSPKVSCQNDPLTFRGMRSAQFRAWSLETLDSYFDDLRTARDSQRNLLKEKYVFMMLEADPELSVKYASIISFPGREAQELVASIMAVILDQTTRLHNTYPHVARTGRPLYASENQRGVTSIETYQRGELLTYSERTLKMLLAHIKSLAAKGESYVERVLFFSIQFYGFDTLEAAEMSVQRQQLAQHDDRRFSCYHFDLAEL
jgi:hypothetical protein